MATNYVPLLPVSAGPTGATGVGITGPAGPTGPTGAVPFTIVGEYNNGLDYTYGDAVYYQGGLYVRTSNPNNPGYAPSPGTINSWTPIAEKGSTGATGPTGATSTVPGPTGVGITGPTGATGAASTVPGPTGPAGATGAAGSWSDAQTIRTITTNSLASTDVGKIVEVNSGSNINITIGSGLGLSAGQRIDVVQIGTGQITFVASGTTLNATPGYKLRAQWSSASIVCRSTNNYLIIGDLAA